MTLARFATRALTSMRGLARLSCVAIGLGLSGHLPAAVQNLNVYPLSGVQGFAISGYVADFTTSEASPSIGDLSAVIDWGDGSATAGTIQTSVIAGLFTVSDTHTYASAGVYSISVNVVDASDFGNETAFNNATILDAPLIVTGAYFPTSLNVAFNESIATFADLNPYATIIDFTATINWGDGSPLAAATIMRIGSSNSYSVTGGHTYTLPGLKVVTVAVNDSNNGNSATGTSYTGDRVFADGFEP